MKASLNWLKRLVDLEGATPEEIAAHFTSAGLEVEAIEPVFQLLGVVVAEVRKCERVEGTKLSSCVVWDGQKELPVICGAANVRAGLKVALATVGTVLPGGLEIKPAQIRGMDSMGMLCAEDELGLGAGHAGILELDPQLEAGQAFAQAVGVADVVFEINVTPNRPDATGHLGLARELALCTGAQLRSPLDSRPTPVTSGRATTVAVSLEPNCGCTRYVGRTFRGLNNGSSPAWMANLLRSIGLRPISALVDITNFVLMELGQPLHAFDSQKLTGPVEVRGARSGERLEILDGRTLDLAKGDLVIADAKGPQCLGGVMGGMHSGVAADTTEIFLETAYFVPSTVRYLARRTQASSDSSYRFERGVDPFATLRANAYATALILDICGGQADEPIELVAPGHLTAPRRVKLSHHKVEGVLGVALTADRIQLLLEGVGCQQIEQGASEDIWELPGWRPDLALDVDLVEEVARLIGYDNLPASFPSFPVAAIKLPARERWMRRIRRSFASRGLSETLSLRFVSKADQEKLGFTSDDPRGQLVQLLNPLSEDISCLPRTAITSLLRAARHNETRQERSVRLFECARIFGADLPDAFASHRTTGIGERRSLVGLVGGPWSTVGWNGASEDVDIWRAKGLLVGTLRDLGLEPEFGNLREPFLHPGRSASVNILGQNVGWFGQIHPTVRDKFGLRGELFGWEIDLDSLIELLEAQTPTQSLPIGEYPGTRREINLVVPRSRSAASVVNSVRELDATRAAALLESVGLASVYQGPGVPEDSKAVLVRMTYRSTERTLTDAEVNATHDTIRQGLAALPDVVLK